MPSQPQENDVLTSGEYRPVTDSLAQQLLYIGEIKGKSYIKIKLQPVHTPSIYGAGNSEVLKYKGSYYESVSGKFYPVTGDFDPELRTWTFICFNKDNQPIFSFSGKQAPDGGITGTWKSKNTTRLFYLRPS
ncbi:hypothetical protein [Desertivirga xinjiangensis]|uniref:hypothetical protein n=1 Tax=Desertivirga xinjiangensis TaxID=539206 RepID=UPI00210E376A|nr:hypothetical protein [Pedobacter xinjiangensis]